jgi:MFS family permease
MLQELGFSYFTYVIVTASAALANFLCLTFWGRRADRFGNRSVLVLTSLLIPLISLLWVVDQHLYWLIPVQFLSGFAWAGFTLCSVNFVYDASPASQRTGYLACFNALNGIALCLGTFIGGYLINHLPGFHGSTILTVFILSGALRAIVAATLLPTFREVRKVRETSLAQLVWGGRQWIASFSYIEAEGEGNSPLNQISNIPADKSERKHSLLKPLPIHCVFDGILERSPPMLQSS